MKWKTHALSASLPGALTLLAMQAFAGAEQVSFPADFERGILYTTVERGNLKEDIYTSAEAIAAAKQGRPLPAGTVITLVDYRDGKLFRYVVMEKRAGWGSEYPQTKRNGEWEYQAFNADKFREQRREPRSLLFLPQAKGRTRFCPHQR